MNKKKIFSLAMVMASTFVIAKGEIKASDLGPDVKTGYFNSAQAVSESKLGKESYAQVEKKRLQFATEFKMSEETYGKKVKSFQEGQSTFTADARQKAEEEIIKMKRDIENKAKEYEEDLKLAMQRAQEKLFKDLSDAVYECGRADSKDVMVDVMSGRVYVINPDKVSITKSIVASMDTKYDKIAKPVKATA